MKKSMVRAALCSSVSFIAPAALAVISTEASAATTCTGTLVIVGTDIVCVDGGSEVATGHSDVPVTPTAQGLSITSLGNATVNLDPGADGDTITTTTVTTPGIIINSGSVLSLTAPDVNVHTTAPVSNAVYLTGTTISATLGDLTTDGTGSNGIVTNSTSNTNVTVGDISGLHNGGAGANLTTTGTGNLNFTVGDVTTGFGPGILATVGGNSTIATGNINSGLAGVTVSSGTGSINLTTGDVSTISDSAPGVSLSTAGAITYIGGDLSTQGDDSEGLLISGGAGAINATTGDVSTQGLNSFGITITGTGSVTIHSGDVSTDAPITDAVQLTGGTIGGTLGDLTTSGTGADGIVTNSTGDTTLTVGNISGLHNGGIAANLTTSGSGTLDFTVGDITVGFGQGILATAGGNSTITAGNINSGTTAINSVAGGTNSITAGTVTANGVFGIFGQGTSVSITTNGVSNAGGTAVQATSTAGDVTIRSGAVSATNGFGFNINTTGNTDIGSCPTVSTTGNGALGIFVAGTGNILVNCGAVSTQGNTSDALRLTSSGGGNIDVTTGAVTTAGTDSDALQLTTSGSGTVTANGGILTTQGDFSFGLSIAGGTGAIGATIAGASTSGDTAYGVDITGSGPVTFHSTGTIATTGDNSKALQITSPGPITVNAGLFTTTGDSSVAFQIAGGSGAINATIAGASTTGTGTGSDAVHIASTGPLTFVNTGSITTTGGFSDGIDIRMVTTANVTCGNISTATPTSVPVHILSNGNTTVTCGTVTGAAGAISVRNTLGTTVVTGGTTTAGGSFDAITLVSDAPGGAVTVNSGTGGVTAGGIGVAALSTAGGNVIVNATGNVTSTGSDALFVATSGAGIATANINSGATVSGFTAGVAVNGATNAVNVNGTLQTSDPTAPSMLVFGAGGPTTVSIGSTGHLNGFATFLGGNDVLNNSGVWNAAGITDFGAGTDALNNQSSGTINLTDNATFANLETFSQTGRINLSTFTLTGPAFAFSNAGTITTTGSAGIAGFTTLSNSGELDLGPGTLTVPAAVFTNSGTINATSGASTITGQTGFANSGTIDLSDGATGDVLTINSDFVGSGASNLVIDAGGSTADRLVITGAASGTTAVNVNGVGTIITTPILVVDTNTSTANAFVLGSTAANPLIDLTLTQAGADYFLTSAPNVLAFMPIQVGLVVPDMWYQSADAYTNYAALRRMDIADDGATGFSIWAQGYANRDRYGDEETATVFGNAVTIDNRVHAGRHGVQFGVDFAPAGMMTAFGITAGYERARANHRSLDGGVHAHAFDLGVYAQYGAPTGFYATLLAKKDWTDVALTNPAFQTGTSGSPDARTTGIEGEVGYRWHPGSLAVEAGAGLAWAHTKFDTFSSNGIDFDLDNTKSLRGRLGVRATWMGSPLRPFLDAKLYHEFDGDSDLTLASGTVVDTVEANGRGTWGRIEAGIGGSSSFGGTLAGWVDVGNVRGVGVKGMIRFGGGRNIPPPYVAPAAPPPPVVEQPAPPPAAPPPPPPPPANSGERGR